MQLFEKEMLEEEEEMKREQEEMEKRSKEKAESKVSNNFDSCF